MDVLDGSGLTDVLLKVTINKHPHPDTDSR
jgi:hypothetical protein